MVVLVRLVVVVKVDGSNCDGGEVVRVVIEMVVVMVMVVMVVMGRW